MDIRLLLVRTIELANLANKLARLDKKNAFQVDDVNQFLLQIEPFIPLPENALDGGLERNSYKLVKDVLMWLVQSTTPEDATHKEIMNRLKIALSADVRYYTIFEETIEDLEDEDTITRRMQVVRRDLQNYLSQQAMIKLIKEASYKAQFKPGEIKDWGSFRENFVRSVSDISFDVKVEDDPAFVSSIDFNDRNALKAAYEEAEQVFSKDGIITTPFQGLNRMLGENRGLRRGEFVNIYGLAHNYKSGMMMDMIAGTVLMNEPHLLNEDMKPAILMVSCEDDVHIMLRKLFTIFKQHELGLPVAISSFTIDQITDYVMDTVKKKGWNLFMYRVVPSQFSVAKYVGLMKDLQLKGYEIVLAVNDYLNKMTKEGIDQNGATGDAIAELHSRVFEFTKPNEITHITGHQLSPDAKRMRRLYPEDFIHRLTGGGFTEGTTKLDQIPDVEIFMNKRDTPHGVFLELAWGKHRGENSVTEADTYCVYKFNERPMYGIPYDADKEDASLKKVGAVSSGGDSEWFNMDM